jgi:hypothetical protein
MRALLRQPRGFEGCPPLAVRALRDGAAAAPTGLADFEVRAARDGLRVPNRYWLYRGVWSASKREEAVESYRALHERNDPSQPAVEANPIGVR